MSILTSVAQTIKTVNKAKNVVLDVKISRSIAEGSSITLKSNPKTPLFAENAGYRAEKEMNLSTFKLLLRKFMVSIIYVDI